MPAFDAESKRNEIVSHVAEYGEEMMLWASAKVVLRNEGHWPSSADEQSALRVMSGNNTDENVRTS